MAPSWVLLDRCLSFDHDETVFAGETEEGGRESIGCASGELKGRPSDEEYRDAITAYLRSLKPDALLADPPELSSIRMLQPAKSVPPLCNHVTSAFISSADKHLVAIYAGYYRPGNSSRGCYLIYDARNNSLSTIPQIPFNNFHDSIGDHTAVVVCDVDGAGYTLAELVRVRSSDIGEAELYLWHSSSDEWVKKAGRLPPKLCTPTYKLFSADTCFRYGGSYVCWVDLLKGMVVCDLRAVQERGSDPEFRFVPLPDECPTYDILDHEDREICGELFRSVACIGGVIKLVTMDGYVERRPGKELTLWTLSSDLSRWDSSKVYDIGNIWANETYQSTVMRKIAPSYPVMSMHEAHVVYLVFTDIRLVAYQKVESKGQYLLRVDMDNSEVKICRASRTDMIIRSQLFACEFSAYRQCLADHPRQVEASQ